jgi:hypothetical protein
MKEMIESYLMSLSDIVHARNNDEILSLMEIVRTEQEKQILSCLRVDESDELVMLRFKILLSRLDQIYHIYNSPEISYNIFRDIKCFSGQLTKFFVCTETVNYLKGRSSYIHGIDLPDDSTLSIIIELRKYKFDISILPLRDERSPYSYKRIDRLDYYLIIKDLVMEDNYRRTFYRRYLYEDMLIASRHECLNIMHLNSLYM